jgi:hypothetical protein
MTCSWGRGCAGVLALASGAAAAMPFQYGDIEGSFDTTLSIGMSARMQQRDPALVGIANGGTARSVNEDDGNLGFGTDDPISAALKATHELSVTWDDYGLFSRVSYFYDAVAASAAAREDRFDAKGLATRDRQSDDYELGALGRDRLKFDADLLDLFVYGNVDIGERRLSTRFGRQVVSWGESTYIGNGINSINPIDVARIRTPGAELKEALLPTTMLWSSFQVADDLGVEGVWMLDYEKTRIDPRGSYFSTNDIVSDDGDKAVVSFGRREDDNSTTRVPAGTDPASAMVWVPREGSPDRPSSLTQFGVALRYLASWLGDTEFGLYYLNYHSRTPLISAVRGGSTNATSATPTCSSDAAATGCRATYYAEFPGNIQLFGLSFNADGPEGIAFQGEYSFRPGQPAQLAGTEVLLSALGVPSSISATPLAAGAQVQGWRKVAMHQAQVTATKAFGPTGPAEQFVVIGEVGANYLDLPGELRFSGPGAGLPACGFQSAGTLAAIANGSCQSEGYATRTSYGYRLVSRMDFENVFGSVGLSPRLVLAHDVHGVGPNFNQGAKALTAGVAANYLQKWQLDFSYTAFLGGRVYSGTDPVPPGTDINPDPEVTTLSPGDGSQSPDFATAANPLKDRDFLSLSLSYAF